MLFVAVHGYEGGGGGGWGGADRGGGIEGEERG